VDQGKRLFEAIAEFAIDPTLTEHRSVGLLGSDTNFAAVQSTAPEGRAKGSANLGSDPKNPSDCGSPFFWLLFFGEAKKSDSPPGDSRQTPES
jgi:hypothetical protein